MNISYFRKSKNSLEQTAKNVADEAGKLGFTVLSETELPGGKMILVCKKEWVKTIIDENYNLLGFLPCSISVFKKGQDIMVGTGSPAVIKGLSQNRSIYELGAKAESEVKKIVENAAGVEALKPKKVKLYSTMTCPYCKMEKAWLEENKVEHEVTFVDLNPDAAQEMVDKTGQMGVPVTEIQYEELEPEFIIGFDKPRLSQILEIK